ncbi:sigma-70 family RNA polymerase sigma factor [Rubinisphaera sp.]|uniref:RNA polymerase sigma factor n=1 Tax=Rubinisphaera sp. TaxID=2024857 RepID=UPI000C0D810D|nr:sigma-70 family RNA polymerase sigma factor [Rubinisphaera sp.]MBV11374.1 RNA polymerase subunit sigma-70 [Rubinisphaera sp.]HCS52402.1 sigma-70 family RNA polymerase sigma factor [Planctomycetaceae bacterium]|tara:strand:+ start:337 stop:954 length:618 start_codon:yes stop_codon:yes gene_type:complete
MNLSPRSHPTDQTSLSLIQRLRNNDNTGWQRLNELYRPLIHFWCRRSQLSESDAEDLTQEVLAIVSAKIDSFQHGGDKDTFRGWLRVITRNQILMHLRATRNSPQGIGGSTVLDWMNNIQATGEESEKIDPQTENTERHILFQKSLELIQSEFETNTWTAFIQTAIDGRNTADVAADLGLSKGAVRTARYRVLRRLRSEFGDILN